MMRWWLDRGVDGFRMDVINKISKVHRITGRPGGRRHRCTSRPGRCTSTVPRMHEFLQEMNREVLAALGAALITVGETSGVTVAEARLLTDAARRELDMVFSFEHVRSIRRETVRRAALRPRRPEGDHGALAGRARRRRLEQPVLVQPRSAAVGVALGRRPAPPGRSANMLATILHLHRGTPYIYQGEELGMTNVAIRRHRRLRRHRRAQLWAAARSAGLDGAEVLAAMRLMSRDNSRTPMQWDASPDAGFSTHRPWLRVNPNYLYVNTDAAHEDPYSVWHHYRRLIALRHDDPVVVDGRFRMLLPEHPYIYAYVRELGDQALLVLGNFSNDLQPIPLPEPRWAHATLQLGNYAKQSPPAAAALRPWESRIYRASSGGYR